MSDPKILYVIYVPPGRTRTVLDAMRLFASPRAKHSAHVTVRGPYQDYQDPRPWSAKVKGRRVNVGGVGSFFEGDQSTVFLRVESAAVRSVWDKLNYRGEYNPHLTIYDGDSRSFAASLQDVLSLENPQFTFDASDVEPLVLGNGPRPLITWYDPTDLIGLMGHPPTAEDVQRADEATRLSWIEELASHLSGKPDETGGRTPAVQTGGKH